MKLILREEREREGDTGYFYRGVEKKSSEWELTMGTGRVQKVKGWEVARNECLTPEKSS